MFRLFRASDGSKSATIVSSETKYTAPTGATAKSDDSPAVLPNLYLAWPMTEKVVAGIAFTSPFGQSTEWEKDSVFRYTAPYFAEIGADELKFP